MWSCGQISLSTMTASFMEGNMFPDVPLLTNCPSIRFGQTEGSPSNWGVSPCHFWNVIAFLSPAYLRASLSTPAKSRNYEIILSLTSLRTQYPTFCFSPRTFMMTPIPPAALPLQNAVNTSVTNISNTKWTQPFFFQLAPWSSNTSPTNRESIESLLQDVNITTFLGGQRPIYTRLYFDPNKYPVVVHAEVEEDNTTTRTDDSKRNLSDKQENDNSSVLQHVPKSFVFFFFLLPKWAENPYHYLAPQMRGYVGQFESAAHPGSPGRIFRSFPSFRPGVLG